MHPKGTRVQLHGLAKAPELNETFGVVLRFDEGTGRFVVRKELARAEEAVTVTVRAANLRPVPRRATLAAVQELIDSAPPGARLTLPRGEVTVAENDDDTPTGAQESEEDEGAGEHGDGAASGQLVTTARQQAKQQLVTAIKQRPKLVLKHAVSLAGMGSRIGGTVLNFRVAVDPDVKGELIELAGVHISGSLDIAPFDVKRVRLSKVAVTAPADEPGIFIDEISLKVPKGEEAEGRISLEDCWVRGGTAGVCINAVGVALRNCRVQGCQTYGVQANATFSIDGCTIGECAKSGRGAGISTRATCIQLRQNGINENRVQRDCYDTQYSGYNPDCRGCVGTCSCSAMALMMGMDDAMIKWNPTGQGEWQKLM